MKLPLMLNKFYWSNQWEAIKYNWHYLKPVVFDSTGWVIMPIKNNPFRLGSNLYVCKFILGKHVIAFRFKLY